MQNTTKMIDDIDIADGDYSTIMENEENLLKKNTKIFDQEHQ
jgi:hypothetical protein